MESASAAPKPIDCLTQDEAFGYLAGSGTGPRPVDVQAHLDGCEACRVALGEALRSLSAASSVRRGPNPLPLTLPVGEVVASRYEILRFIACGGMGEVYEARDLSLNEVVALKTLVLTAINDADAVARLRREVRLARRVTHPNVCRILEFGEYHPRKHPTETIPFLTMEFLRGETLAQRLSRLGRIPGPDAAGFLAQIAAGLGAVHAAGIVHRDIKPQNVFILPGPPERALVMDFGLARTLNATHSAITGARVVGTADYMAPEQVYGSPPDRSFDIYALGVVAFEMLTGQKPFPSQTPAAFAAHVAERRVSPRPTSIVPELNPSWDALVGRSLAFDPKNRFSRAEDIELELRKGPKSAALAKRPFSRWTDALAILALATAIFFVIRKVARRSASPVDAAPPAVTLAVPGATAPVPVLATAVPPAPPSAGEVRPPTRPTAASSPVVPPPVTSPIAAPNGAPPAPPPMAAPSSLPPKTSARTPRPSLSAGSQPANPPAVGPSQEPAPPASAAQPSSESTLFDDMK